jgi:menaquinone-specific isochorismate synthase
MILSITDLKKQLLSFLQSQDFSEKEEGILLNFAYKIEETNINSLIDPLIKENKKVFYFNRPEEDLTFLAIESAFSLRINGRNKFSEMGKTISSFSQSIISNIDKGTSDKFPLFVGGTKFYTGKNSDEWMDFKDNDWFLPQFLFYKKEKSSWLVINIIIKKNDEPEVLINCLLEQLELLNKTKTISEDNNAGIKTFENVSDQVEWKKLISDAVSKINEGLFRKVVFSRRIIAAISTTPFFKKILQKLQDNYNNCTIFLYRTGNSLIFGATPEQLLKLKNDELEFDALAGSAKRGETKEDDDTIACSLLNDKKNTEEHNHVIEFIKDTSSQFVRNMSQSDTVIKKFSNIQHLYTPIRAQIKSAKQIYNLIDEIYPTPAICGYPKETSFNYINENEKFDRGLFSGIIGFISPEEVDLVVAIRCALMNNNKLYIYAGCGIVKDSDPLSEFEETEIKMKPILSLFNEN